MVAQIPRSAVSPNCTLQILESSQGAGRCARLAEHNSAIQQNNLRHGISSPLATIPADTDRMQLCAAPQEFVAARKEPLETKRTFPGRQKQISETGFRRPL